ncbi:hypothetical protein GOODEAATRI_022807, partial [Goodea atripinnis]
VVHTGKCPLNIQELCQKTAVIECHLLHMGCFGTIGVNPGNGSYLDYGVDTTVMSCIKLSYDSCEELESWCSGCTKKIEESRGQWCLGEYADKWTNMNFGSNWLSAFDLKILSHMTKFLYTTGPDVS